MLELLGRGYVIEHCISSFKNKKRLEALTIYATDCLYTIANGIYGGGNKAIKDRFCELIERETRPKETEDEIINRIKQKLGN